MDLSSDFKAENKMRLYLLDVKFSKYATRTYTFPFFELASLNNVVLQCIKNDEQFDKETSLKIRFITVEEGDMTDLQETARENDKTAEEEGVEGLYLYCE